MFKVLAKLQYKILKFSACWCMFIDKKEHNLFSVIKRNNLFTSEAGALGS